MYISNEQIRKISISTIHATLYLLESKGFIESYSGEASPTRGGRSKRLYRINLVGRRALEKVRMQRETMWGLIPKTPG